MNKSELPTSGVWTATDERHHSTGHPTYTFWRIEVDHGIVDEHGRKVGGRAWAWEVQPWMSWYKDVAVGSWYAGIQATRNGTSYGASQSGKLYPTEAEAKAACERALATQRKSYARKYATLQVTA
jgi:hypothetical protein